MPKSKGRIGGPDKGSVADDVKAACSALYEYDRMWEASTDEDAESLPRVEFCSEDRELRDVDDDEAAMLVYGMARGLYCATSAGVDEPKGLGEGDALGNGIAEGDGGNKSDMPSLCSDVTEGICTHAPVSENNQRYTTGHYLENIL